MQIINEEKNTENHTQIMRERHTQKRKEGELFQRHPHFHKKRFGWQNFIRSKQIIR